MSEQKRIKITVTDVTGSKTTIRRTPISRWNLWRRLLWRLGR